MNWLICWFIHSFIHSFIDWLIDTLIYWLIDLLIDWFVDSFIHSFIDRLIHWFIDLLSHCSFIICLIACVQITERLEETLRQYDSRALSSSGRYNWLKTSIFVHVRPGPPLCIIHLAMCFWHVLITACRFILCTASDELVQDSTVHICMIFWLFLLGHSQKLNRWLHVLSSKTDRSVGTGSNSFTHYTVS